MQGPCRVEMPAEGVAVEGNKNDVSQVHRDELKLGIWLRADNRFVKKYELRKEWELIPESGLNMRLYVSVSVPLQITLGVLITILPVRQIIGYFGKFG